MEKPQVIVVEASAGSGKTYALAKRYLQIVINPVLALEQIPIETILAITFTNKATIEMKERILELLKKIAFNAFTDKEEENDILKSLDVSKEYAERKAYLIMEEIVKRYNSFQIKTIDSFINTLLLGCAFRVDRSSKFVIKKDSLPYVAYCLDLIFDEVGTDTEELKLLEDFLEHYLFVENRQGWFPKEDILELMEFLFSLCNKYGRTFKTLEISSSDILKKKKMIYKKIENFYKEEELQNAKFSKIKDQIETFLENSPYIQIKNIPLVFKDIDKYLSSSANLKKKAYSIQKVICQLAEREAFGVYNPYIRLFSRLIYFFHLISQREDVLFLEELNSKARCLFGDNGITVAELYYRFAARFKHYLIDEFQDTSVLQWHNLYLMIEDTLASGGSLFYVGDKKQAIYRFRGGEVSLFDEVKKQFGKFNAETSHLINNWRSQRSIVEFNNYVFSSDNLAQFFNLSGIFNDTQGDTGNIFDIFKDAHQEYCHGNDYGYVRVERIYEKNITHRNEIMQDKLLNLIEELKSRFALEDIAILSRDNNEVELISFWLLEKGVSVESEKTLNVMENPLIKDLLLFLAFLNSPIDDLSFAGFILSDTFLEITGLSHDEVSNFLFAINYEGRGELSLYRLFQEKYKTIWDNYIDEFFKNVGFVSLYELITSIYQRFNLMQKFSGNQAFYMKFLEVIKIKENEFVTLEQLFTYIKHASLDDLYVSVSRSNAVKILTIHKAKGLEFPVVILPFLRIDISPEMGGKNISSYILIDDGNLELARITKSHRLYSPLLQNIYVQSYKKSCIDELNNIYVGLTRAQYELYIFIPKKSGISNNKACSLIPETLKEKGIQYQYSKRNKKDTGDLWIDISPSQYKDWIKLLKNEVESRVIENRDKILEGDIIHTIFSQIVNVYGQDKEKILEDAVAYAESRYHFIRDFSGFESLVRNLLGKEEMKDFFSIPEAAVFCEKEVVDSRGDLKRVDRLIVSSKQVIIIDYKTSKSVYEEHKEQILEYIQIMQDIYPSKEVLGFLLYVLEGKIEEVK